MRSLLLPAIVFSLFVAGCAKTPVRPTVPNESEKPKQQAKTRLTDEQRKSLETQWIEKVKKAPKRQSWTPITVAVVAPELSAEIQKSIGNELIEAFQREMSADSVVRLAPDSVTERYRGLVAGGRSGPFDIEPTSEMTVDAVVTTTAKFKRDKGPDPKTGQLVEAYFFEMSGEVVSNWLPEKYPVKRQLHWSKNKDAVKEYVSQLKNVIREKLGPTIPASGQGIRASMVR